MADALASKIGFSLDQRRGMLAIVDQSIVSGTNFLTTALVGRVAGVETLGLYGIGFSLIIITGSVQQSLLVMPFSVFVHRSHPDRRAEMRGATLVFGGLTMLAVALVALVAFGVIVALGDDPHEVSPLPAFAAVMALALPAWMLRGMARQLSLADLRFHRAIAIDAFQSAIQLTLIVTLAMSGRLDAVTAVSAIAVSCLAAGVGWLALIKSEARVRPRTLYVQWLRTWRFGRWGALSQTSHVVGGYVLSWILLLTGGLKAAGLYAATASIVQLASPFIQGAGNAMGPLLAKRYADGGLPRLRTAVNRLTVYAMIAAALYLVLIGTIGPHVMTAVYGDQYGDTTLTLILLAGASAIAGATLIASKVTSVLEYPQVNFALNLAGLLLTVLFAAGFGHAWGIEGAAAGLLVSASIIAAAKWWCYRIVSR